MSSGILPSTIATNLNQKFSSVKNDTIEHSAFYFDQENQADYNNFENNNKNVDESKKIGLNCCAKRRMSICANCNLQITDRFIMKVHPDLEYHTDCLVCCQCEQRLSEKSTVFIRGGKTYCRQDYFKIFSKRCARCQNTLHNTDKIMRARTLLYHLQCFSCSSCEKLLTIGEYFIIRYDEIFCRPECIRFASSPTTKMQQTFFNKHQNNNNFGGFPPFVVAQNEHFSSAAPMPQNSVPLPSVLRHHNINTLSSVLEKNNSCTNLMTTSGNENRASTSSPPLGLQTTSTPSSAFDFVQNANNFENISHNANDNIFLNKQFNDSSDEIVHDFLVGENDGAGTRHQTHSSMSTSSGANSPYSNADSVTAPSSTNSGCVASGAGNGNSGTSTSTTASGMPTKKSKKDKPAQRVRTVLNEGQLKILRQMYNSNQRPDTTVKEQLVEMTGLSARVIRVWFQNKRCKDKKKENAFKEFQQNQVKEQTLHGVRVNGVGPLVAEPPMPLMHEAMPSNILNAVDIRPFAQNSALWNASNSLPPFHQPVQIDSQRAVMMHNMVNNGSEPGNCASSAASLPYGDDSNDFMILSQDLLNDQNHLEKNNNENDAMDSSFLANVIE